MKSKTKINSSSYDTGIIQSIVENEAGYNNGYRAGYSFQNASVNATYLYLDGDNRLKFISDNGDIKNISTDEIVLKGINDNSIKAFSPTNRVKIVYTPEKVLPNNMFSVCGISSSVTEEYCKLGHRAGYGFHNTGTNGVFLYLDRDTKLKFKSQAGAISVLMSEADVRNISLCTDSFDVLQTSKKVNNTYSKALSNDSYNNAPFVATSSTTNTSAGHRAGYGFHNGGLNGGFLYLDSDGKLKIKMNNGVVNVIKFE